MKEVKEYSVLIYVMDYEKNIHQAHIIISELDNGSGKIDGCSLYVPSFRGAKVKISKKAPRQGDDVIAMAAPAGIYHPPTVLVVKGIFSGDIDASSSLSSLPATGGSSGSGVLNENMELVSILYAVHPHFRHATVITNYNSTIDFLKKTLRQLYKK